jgi:hypothetical protein
MKIRAAACLLIGSLAACGGQHAKPSEDVRETIQEIQGETAGWPKCSDVWVEGKKLAEDYEGCVRKVGASEVAELGVKTPCPSDADLFTYEPPGGGFFTNAEGVIVDGGEDYSEHPDYKARFEECG